MTFEEILPLIKKGKKASRAGWNDKDMFVVAQKGYPEGIPANKQTADAYELEEGALFKVEPYLQMRTATGSHVMWCISNLDVFANDWEVYNK
ncbi:hypothetical protein QLX41_gp188 [Listeria phage LMTA-94]|uniref:Thoeris anti-defense 2-like domain-containing protein n=1 Tax=Listeria phage LMTA-94 TaxID=1486419 RepID=A0A068CAD9_9CAUD|nr:hypothetical protein QLX41_gp188 [Listeria phage LMTA-94]AID17210.1 hypothetical protein [Listeria phage LMTA-94]